MIRPLEIAYHRPPDHHQIYRQELIFESPAVQVSFQPAMPIDRPMVIGGDVALEPGSPVVWFTFPGAWHDIGRFHDAEGRFTGLYANVLTPVELHRTSSGPARWATTDLFLDLWHGVGRDPVILDEEEWAAAREAGHIDGDTAARARREADALRTGAASGAWPPAVVAEWTLVRTLRARGERGGTDS